MAENGNSALTPQQQNVNEGNIPVVLPARANSQQGAGNATGTTHSFSFHASGDSHSVDGGAHSSSRKKETKGNHAEKNSRKKQNLKKAASSKSSAKEAPVDWRFQLRLVNGFPFTDAMKNELIRHLNKILYSLPLGTATPSFNGYGLRFGLIWFAPANQESSTWLRQILESVSAGCKVSDRFVIEPFCLHQNSISLLVPWDEEEKLTLDDVSRRLLALNPGLNTGHWKFVGMKSFKGQRLFYWSVTDDCVEALRACNRSVNYGFKKLFVRIRGQK